MLKIKATRSRRLSVGLVLFAVGMIGIVFWLAVRHVPSVPETQLSRFLQASPFSQTENDLIQSVSAAFSGNVRQAEKLIKAEHFAFRTLFHKLLFQALVYRYQKKDSSAAPLLELARNLALVFQTQFDDDFLQREYNFVINLKPREVRKKLDAEYYYTQAQNYLGRQHYGLAKKHYQYSLRLSRSIRDCRREIDNLVKLQYLEYFEGDYQRAIEIGEETLRLTLTHGYKYRETWTRLLTASTLFQFGRYNESIPHLNRALKTATRLGDQQAVIRILERIGVAVRRLGDLDRALEMNRKAMEIAREFGNERDILNCWINFGLIYRSRGEFSLAKQYYEKALELASQLKDANRGSVLINLGHLSRRLGLYTEALQYSLQAMDFYIQNGDKYYLSLALKNIGDIYLETGADSAALRYYHRSLMELRQLSDPRKELQPDRTAAEIRLSMGDVYLRQQDTSQAVESYQYALEKFGETQFMEGLAHALIRSGNLNRYLKKYDKAREQLEQAVRIANRLHDPLLLSNGYFSLGQYFLDHRDLARAEDQFDRAIQVIEETRSKLSGDPQITYFARTQDIYNAMIALKFDQGDDAAAFEFSERSRARSLFDLVHQEIEKPGATVALPPGLREIQAQLPEEVQLLEYKLLQDRLLIFVLDRYRLLSTSVRIPADTLRQAVFAFRRLLGAENLEQFHRRFRRNRRELFLDEMEQALTLSKVLLQPVLYDLNTEKVLYILPDDVLFYLPFAALPLPDGFPETAPFLIEKYTIAFTPSAAWLSQHALSGPAGSRADSLSMLTVANPTGDLIAAEHEVRRISSLGQRSRVLIGKDISEAAFLREVKRNYRIIHFATHAVIDDIRPMESYLVLGPASRAVPAVHSGNTPLEDNRLHTREVFQLDLEGTELITLAACYTAGGRLFRGEGLFGLTQAFLKAGARSVITSLWEIDDQFTSDLMAYFYKSYLQREFNKAEAMRQAQLQLIREMRQDPLIQYAYPFAWAAFIVMGDYR